MSETLYPHEVAIKFIGRNILRFNVIYSCILSGISFRNGDLDLSLIALFIGLLSQHMDYKYRKKWNW